MTNQKTYNEKIFETTAPDFKNSGEKNCAEKALKYAHEIRQFEIGLYWKRSLIFWGFTLAFFVGLTAIISLEDQSLQTRIIALLISYLGLFTTWAWYFVEVGSKSWQNNWEKHIDLLEDPFTGKLHKTVIGDKNKFFSMSKINKTFIVVMIIFWIVIVGLMTSQSFDDLNMFSNCWLTNYGFNSWRLWLLSVIIIAVVILCLVGSFSFCKYLKFWEFFGYWKTGFETIPETSAKIKNDSIPIKTRLHPNLHDLDKKTEEENKIL